MALLTKKKPTENGGDWRADPSLTDAQGKLAALDQKLAAVSREVSEAETAWFEAREKFEDSLLLELLEKATPEEVKQARAHAERAQRAYEQAKERVAPLTKAYDRLRQELTPLEAEAKQRAVARLMEAYAGKVRSLAEILMTAESANTEIAQLYRAMTACAPERESWAVPAVSLSWPEFLHNPNHDDGGRLGRWRQRVANFLAGRPDVISPPPAEGNTRGETEAERQVRRRRASEGRR